MNGQFLNPAAEGGFDNWLLYQLNTAYYNARKGKRGTEDEQMLEIFAMENLMQLRDDILSRRYRPGRSIAFMVYKPVPREIFAAPFRDRVIHHFLYNMVAEWWDRRFIRDSYSCRVGKGVLDGIMRLVHHIRSVSQDYTKEAYVIKLDIQGYFTSLNRKLLYERINWGLERQFERNPALRDMLKFIWKQVIFDDPTDGAMIRGSRHDWDVLPAYKSLFNQPAGQGIVIGNLSSQLLSNVFLSDLDWFVKNDLGYQHYGRYVDDFFLVVTEERLAQALKDVKLIERRLADQLLLTLHPNKRHVQEVSKGVEFLGAVVYPNRIVPTRRFVGNFYETAELVVTGERDLDSLISYIGHLAHFNGKRLTRRVFERIGQDYVA